MDDDIRRIKELLLKQLKEELNPSEEAELKKWAGSSPVRQALMRELTDEHTLHEKLRQFAQTEEKDVWEHKKIWDVIVSENDHMREGSFRWWKYAASFVLLLASAAVFYFILSRQPGIPDHPVNAAHHDIEPGRDKAVLTLADGKRIVLDSTASGILAKQGNTDILQRDNGQLVYHAGLTEPEEDQPVLNTIATPKGGQYRLVLPDGSQVWLNSASSITFPAVFSGNERRVEITGECYFEISSNPKLPFKVSIEDRMHVEVLGTHFNIMAYPEENVLAATLLEGSVNITVPGASGSAPLSSQLTPGEQARLSAGKAATQPELSVVRLADPAEIIAWKNGLFRFRNANIQHIMRQLSRWYDLQVSYEGELPDIRITGEAPRELSLLELVELLELSDIRMKINGKNVTVMR